MKSLAAELFDSYAFIVVFLHILSAVVWVGGMIFMRISVHSGLQHIKDKRTRLARMLEVGNNMSILFLPFVVFSLLTGVVLSFALGASDTIYGTFMHTKEGIWTVMTILYAYMAIRTKAAERLFISGDLGGAEEGMESVANIVLPLNIMLGVAALAMGVTLRGY